MQNTDKFMQGILRRDRGGTMQDDVLRVDVSHVGEVTWVTVHGEIDANSALALRAPLDQLGMDRQVLVDMSGVSFMDSSGVNLLLTHWMHMSECEGSFHICRPSSAVQRLLDVTGLSQLLLEPEPLA
jgi:anti-anti-sigma factor